MRHWRLGPLLSAGFQGRNQSGQATEARGDVFLALDDVAHPRCYRCRARHAEEVIFLIESKTRESWVAPPQIR